MRRSPPSEQRGRAGASLSFLSGAGSEGPAGAFWSLSAPCCWRRWRRQPLCPGTHTQGRHGEPGKDPVGLGLETEGCGPLAWGVGPTTDLPPEPSSPTRLPSHSRHPAPARDCSRWGEGCPQRGAGEAPLESGGPDALCTGTHRRAHGPLVTNRRSGSAQVQRTAPRPRERGEAHALREATRTDRRP